MRKPQRYFNTSGPNIPSEHYTLPRKDLIAIGQGFVHKARYFTIWAPRQTGKSTYFILLQKALIEEGYKVLNINVENYLDASKKSFLQILSRELNQAFHININPGEFTELHDSIKRRTGENWVLIIDEIEGLNPELFGQFMHTLRNLYHSRNLHCLKSVILVGVSNIVGIVQDHASPFNIADNLEIPYFTDEETRDLLGQHESETGQKFEDQVKSKISQITANQPGLVNGFARKLVEDCEGQKVITYEDYLKVEDWYLTEAIDKNVSNIIQKAEKHRGFVEQLLYTDHPVGFRINRPEIKELHTNGLIRKDQQGNIEFWVPLYKKALYDAFYPAYNGEGGHFFNRLPDFFALINEGEIDFDFLIQNFKDYVKRRSFRAFREKDPETGKFKSIKEAALRYSFETYMALFLSRIEAKSYNEVDTGLGRSDLLVNFRGREYVIETKVFRESYQIQKGLKQLAYYCNSLNIPEGIYLVFASNQLPIYGIEEGMVEMEGVNIRIYLVPYDEEKDF